MLKTFHRFKRSDSGVAAIEFSIILPVMIIILIGIIETSRMARFDQKLKSATFQLADLVTQNDEVTNTMLTQYTNAVSQIMDPYEFEGTVIFTSVASLDLRPRPGRDDAVADPAVSAARADVGCLGGCIVWQRRTIGSGSSRVGTAGGEASMPNEYELLGTQNVMVVEIFANYTPMLEISRNLIEAFTDRETYAVAVYKPRMDSLLQPPQ